jgi:hypothetical protein
MRFIAFIITILASVSSAQAQNWNGVLNQAIQAETNHQVPQASGVVNTGQLLNGQVDNAVNPCNAANAAGATPTYTIDGVPVQMGGTGDCNALLGGGDVGTMGENKVNQAVDQTVNQGVNQAVQQSGVPSHQQGTTKSFLEQLMPW